MDILPSNAPDWPRRPPPRHRRTGAGLLLLALAITAVSGILATAQTFIGLDQLARSVVSIATRVRLPASDPPDSRNWAGYAATGGTFTAVSATWNVPDFAPNSPAGADAIWVGIGGVRGTDLIQAGTQETVSGRGLTEYQAWVETLPEASRPVPLSISAGDSINVSLQQETGRDWLITFTNNTSGKSYQVTLQYASSLSSAEWVVEAPSARRGRVLPLDTFGSISFSQASAVKNGQTLTIGQAGGHSITMIGQRGQTLARPSSLDEAGARFNVLQSLL